MLPRADEERRVIFFPRSAPAVQARQGNLLNWWRGADPRARFDFPTGTDAGASKRPRRKRMKFICVEHGEMQRASTVVPARRFVYF
jgi:hypothetical protein